MTRAFSIRLTLPVSLPGLTRSRACPTSALNRRNRKHPISMQSSIPGLWLLDRPVKPGDDSTEVGQPNRKYSKPERSEIRLVGLGKRCDVVTEVPDVVGLANVFNQRNADAPPRLDRRPGHVEGAGIVDGDEHLQRVAAIDHLEALDDVHLFGMRSAIIVDKRPVIQSDGVDHQLVALVMPHGFAVP